MDFSLWRLLPNLAVSLVAPVVVYGVLRGYVHSDVTALAISAAVPLVWTLLRYAITRRLDPIGLVGVVGIGTGLLFAWLSGGDPIMLELRDAIPVGLLGLACLVSALFRRPLLVVLLRLAARRYPALRGRDPRVLRVFNVLVGALLVVHSAVLVGLALVLPVSTYVDVSRPIGLAIFGAGLLGLLAYRRRLTGNAP